MEKKNTQEKQPSSKTTGEKENKIESETQVESETQDDSKIKKNDSGEKNEDASKGIKDPIEEKNKEIAELKDRMARMLAETENYKRRMTKEKNDHARFANERLIKEIIPLYENFDRALTAKDANADTLRQGVEMIFKQFTSILDKENLKAIPTVGEKFDPNIHEALSQMESADHDENTVIQEFAKGFYFNNRVLLPAKVVISKLPAKPDPEAGEKAVKPDKEEVKTKGFSENPKPEPAVASDSKKKIKTQT